MRCLWYGNGKHSAIWGLGLTSISNCLPSTSSNWPLLIGIAHRAVGIWDRR